MKEKLKNMLDKFLNLFKADNKKEKQVKETFVLNNTDSIQRGETIVSVKDLEVQFKVRAKVLTAIRKISIDIKKGETFAIVGESGSGKSVFTKTLVGMLEENGNVSGGQILYSGVDLAKFKKIMTG